MNLRLRRYLTLKRREREEQRTSRLRYLLRLAEDALDSMVGPPLGGTKFNKSDHTHVCVWCGMRLSADYIDSLRPEQAAEIGYMHLHPKQCPVCYCRMIRHELARLKLGQDDGLVTRKLREAQKEIEDLRFTIRVLEEDRKFK